MYIIIVAGASGSGKSTIVKIISERMRQKSWTVNVVAMDQYYHSMKPGEPLNWDHFSAIDKDLLVSDLTELINGSKTVKLPDYDYVTHQRIPEAREAGEPDLLILEGIFALYDEKIRKLANLKIYVEADPINTCLQRRIHRDLEERGRSADSVITQYFDQVLPGYKEFVGPTKKYADLCYTNEREVPTLDTKFIQIVTSCIEQKI